MQKKLIYEKGKFENITGLDICFSVGSKNDPIGKEGLAHLLEHLIFSKSYDRDFDYFRLAAIKGVTFNAYTSTVNLVLTFAFLSKDIDFVLEFIDYIVFSGRRISQEAFAREKETVYNEAFQCECEPFSVFTDRICETIFEDSPFSRKIVGTKDSIDEIHLRDVFRMRRNFITKDNCNVAIVTDLEQEEIIHKFNEILDIDLQQEAVQIPFNDYPLCKLDSVPVKLEGVDQKYVANVHLFDRDELNYVSFLSYLLTGTINSPMWQKFRDELGGVYSFDSFLITQFYVTNKIPLITSISYNLDSETSETYDKTLDDIFKNLFNLDYDSSYFEAAKNNLLRCCSVYNVEEHLSELSDRVSFGIIGPLYPDFIKKLTEEDFNQFLSRTIDSKKIRFYSYCDSETE